MSLLRIDTDFDAWRCQISAEADLLALKSPEVDAEKARLLLMKKWCDPVILEHSSKAFSARATANTLEEELRSIWIREQRVSWNDLEMTILSRDDLTVFRNAARRLKYISSWSEDLALDRLYRALSSLQSLQQLVKGQAFKTVEDALTWLVERELLPVSSVATVAERRRPPPTCFFCKKVGHIAKHCFNNPNRVPKNAPSAARS